jgi:alkaline phosphatase
MKKRIRLIAGIAILCLLLAIGITFSVLEYQRHPSQNKEAFSSLEKTKEVILFIGDGMGFNEVKTTEIRKQHSMSFSSFPVQGKVSTCSLALFTPTDSAASASALATGRKYNNGEIAWHHSKDISSISEYAKSLGKGVGIVTTDSLSGATPAAFSSHAKKRGDTNTIIHSQIESNIDLFLGAGRDTYLAYQSSFEEAGYRFFTSKEELTSESQKRIGTFSKVGYDDSLDEPTLKTLTRYAILSMEEQCPNGYFLMIEGAHIDKMSHDNNLEEMMNYLDGFSSSVREAIDLLEDKDYTVMVTADHETGKMSEAGIYHSKGHTSADVPYYIKSSKPWPTKFPKKIDNTAVYQILLKLL